MITDVRINERNEAVNVATLARLCVSAKHRSWEGKTSRLYKF